MEINMNIQYLNGGLANQVFQYIFVRYAELTHPQNEPWFFDDSFFFVNNVHNGFELEKVFGLKLNLLSRFFDTDVWDELIANKRNGISIPQSFKKIGLNIVMITEFENYKSHNPFDGVIYHVPGNAFLPEITGIRPEQLSLESDTGLLPMEHLYYHGYWLHPDWFRSNQEILRKELTFPPIRDTKNLEYAKQIQNSHSVAIHVRRGDYVTIGWASDVQYYHAKAAELLSRCPDAVFFIFSDDIDWCRQNQDALGFSLPHRTVFVEGNTNGTNHIDLQLMSMCPLMIIGKSAFGSLAMLLNEHLEYAITDL